MVAFSSALENYGGWIVSLRFSALCLGGAQWPAFPENAHNLRHMDAKGLYDQGILA